MANLAKQWLLGLKNPVHIIKNELNTVDAEDCFYHKTDFLSISLEFPDLQILTNFARCGLPISLKNGLELAQHMGKPNRAKQAGWDLTEFDSCGRRCPFKRDLFITDHS